MYHTSVSGCNSCVVWPLYKTPVCVCIWHSNIDLDKLWLLDSTVSTSLWISVDKAVPSAANNTKQKHVEDLRSLKEKSNLGVLHWKWSKWSWGFLKIIYIKYDIFIIIPFPIFTYRNIHIIHLRIMHAIPFSLSAALTQISLPLLRIPL